MPELSCENPSREELQSYLNEHWEDTKKGLEYFRNGFGVDFKNLAGKFYDSILNSLYRLNDFPRENKFWHNTNNKPTIYKLDEFCQLKLSENPNDILALGGYLASRMKMGAPTPNLTDIINKLVQLGEMKADLLVELYLTEDITYDGNGNDFAELLIKLGLQNDSKVTLENLAKSKNDFVSNWARTALEKIKNQ